MNFNFILQPALMCCNTHLPDARVETKLSNAINTQAKKGKVNAVHSTALCFDYGAVNGFLADISYVSSLRSDHNY